MLERISDLPLPFRHLPSPLLLISTFGLDQVCDIVHWEIAEFVSLGAEHGDLVLGVSRHTVRVGHGGWLLSVPRLARIAAPHDLIDEPVVKVIIQLR